MIPKAYTLCVTQCKETFFFNFVMLAVLLYRAYKNVWPNGLNVLKIEVILWENYAPVQTAEILYCVLSYSICRS
jgi:hypothetical protein